MLDDPNATIVKTALQRACELFEVGQAFTDPRFLEVALRNHLKSDDLKVRRWSYKLAGRLRAPSLLPLLEEAVGSEAFVDAENRSWALAAYLGYAPVTDRKRVIGQLGAEYHESALELASRFFSIGEPEPFRSTLVARNLEDDPLSRKWLSMLVGYAATEPRTIHREFSDLDIVRDFVFDDDPENVEYALWAENRHPLGSPDKLREGAHKLLEHQNVRRWLFQVLTKTEASFEANQDLLLERMDPRYEPSDIAREGLAQGIARLPLLDRIETVDWYAAEGALGVKLALVDHLARRARKGDHHAMAQLQADYAQLDPRELLAMKIEAASDPAWLADIKSQRQVSLIDLAPIGGQLLLGSTQPNLTINNPQGDVIVTTDNSRNITQHGAGSSVTGVNMGEMFASTLNALSQNKDQSIAAALPAMEEFVRALEAEKLPDEDRQAGAQMVKEVTEAPDPQTRKSKLSVLRTFVRGLIAAPEAGVKFIESGKKLIDAIGPMLS